MALSVFYVKNMFIVHFVIFYPDYNKYPSWLSDKNHLVGANVKDLKSSIICQWPIDSYYNVLI